LVPHGGQDKSPVVLIDIRIDSQDDKKRQETDPEVVGPIADENLTHGDKKIPD
jgi:hypothetical protein